MKLSLVIPSFNEQENIALLYQQIIDVIGNQYFEAIFVDDGSHDNTFNEIKKLALSDPRIKGLSFSRNFGHQIALTAGLNEAIGDLVVMMDADGQHPPKVIPQLIAEQLKGYDIVNTRRLTTADATATKNLTSKLYYKLINRLTEVKIEPASSDFRLMTRKAVDAFLQFDEKERFTRGMVSWMGFNQSIIDYHAPERMTGQSKYTFRKMLRFAFTGITSFSSKPLKFSTYAGIFALIFGALYSVYILIMYIMGRTITGWTSLMLIVILFGGVQLLSLGIIGEYLSRIFIEAKNRPLYFIKEKC